MLNGDGNENGKKITWSNKQKKKNNFARHSTLFCTFLCRCCCNVKLPSNTFCGENVVVLTKNFVACVPVSFLHFTAAHFHLEGRWHLSFTRYKIFMLFFQRNSSPLFLISRSSLSAPTFSFSLCFAFSIFQICGHDN